MPRGQYERTPERLAYMREPFTCPKCHVTFPGSGGKGTHIRHCGKQDEVLWARIDKNHPSGCWVYTGATDRRGYGRPAIKTKRYYAHRRSYEIHKGPIPDGMLVLHSCDNPPCCNPEHLSLGLDADNHRDMRARGRANYISRAKLAADQVREIRASPGTKEELAAKYSVSPGTIYNIKTRRIWKNI